MRRKKISTKDVIRILVWDLLTACVSVFPPEPESILVIQNVPHPRIIVVTKVTIELTIVGLCRALESSAAPSVPRRKPAIFTTITQAAVTSILSPCLRQRITVIAIVSSVSISSSLMLNTPSIIAVSACATAKPVIIRLSVLMFFFIYAVIGRKLGKNL